MLDQAPAAVPGAPGHREAFGVERPDRGANHQLLYHRCFNYPDGKLSIDICLDESEDGGVTFPISHGVIMPNSLGNFAVAPSVALVNGTWTMVWEEGGAPSGAYWATSNDGISWQKQGELLVGSAYNATPSLYTFQGTVYVFAAQFIEPQVLGIVFFSGPSMNSLTQYGNGFVLKGEQPWSKGGVSMPRVVYQEGVHYMIHEGSSVNFLCGATPAEPNTWGWGIARSTTLTEWESWSGNPVMQGEDGESCGRDMPQPLLRQDGSFFVYHTSDDVSSIERERLAPGSACTAEQLAAGWREKNRVCLPSCGGAMGNACYQTKDCPSGTKVPGGSYDCASCCQ